MATKRTPPGASATKPRSKDSDARSSAAGAGATGKSGKSGAPPAIEPGKSMPSFTIHDQQGQEVSTAGLRGTPYVLYFYPKDNTPGCTTEARDFQALSADFAAIGVRVLGCSADSAASHQRFATKHGLEFTLLADPDHALIEQCGAWALKQNYGREYWGIVRSTILVDSAGVVRQHWPNVRVAGHAQAVLSAAKELL